VTVGARARQVRGVCPHTTTITVITAGIERVICEACGSVSLRYESMISGEVDRARFSRRADELHAHRRAPSEVESAPTPGP